MPSSRRGPFGTSTISTRNSAAGATSSRISGRIPSSAIGPWPQVFADEQPRLLPLPAHPFETELVRPVVSGKLAYVRFDRNSYSIPHTHVRRPLTLLASATTVRVVDGADELARHARSYDTGQTIEDLGARRGPRSPRPGRPIVHTGRDRLRLAVPAIATLLERLAARGESLRLHTHPLAGAAR